MWNLAIDASTVMTMRAAKLAQGGAAAAAEANLMVAEKVEAAAAAQIALMTGKLGRTPATMQRKLARHYGMKVRANRRRLARRS